MANASLIEGRGAVSKTALDKDPVEGASVKPHVIYAPWPEATPEGEQAALASVYRFLLDRHKRRSDDIATDGAEERDEHAK
jgi:hypothetical protein